MTDPRRILVIGASGMLGIAVMKEAAVRGHYPIGIVRRKEAERHLQQLGFAAQVWNFNDDDLGGALDPDFAFLVNCAGITKARAIDPEETIRINSLLPHRLAKLSSARAKRLIHVSTDCVFSGRKGAYTEDDLADPEDLYGRSKLLGEVQVRPHLTLRTSFIGREHETKHGLVEWFLSQTGSIKGHAAAIWSGLTAPALSRVILDLGDRTDITGLLNIGGSNVDKNTLLHLMKSAFKKTDVTIVPSDTPAIDRSLNSTKAAKLGIRIPDLPTMIQELTAWDPQLRNRK